MKKSMFSIFKLTFSSTIRTVFMLLMSLQISLGQLVNYMDGLEQNEIELTEEGDLEPEEKKEKEEIKKDEFLNKLFFSALSSQKKLHLNNITILNWGASQDEVPTPPPRDV